MIPDPNSTAKYWQWILAKSRDENPLVNGEINIDKFIALPCTGGGEDCGRVVDLFEENAYKNILIPIYCAEYCTAEISDPQPTDQKILQTLRADVCSPVFMECVVDGHRVEPYYVESAPFDIIVPANNMLDGNPPAGTYRAMAAGYWHLLKPLPSGKHVITFGGTGKNGFHTKVQYILNVRQNPE